MSDEPIWWPVPSGTTVRVEVAHEQPLPNTASVYFPTVVSSTGEERRALKVAFDDPTYVNRLRVGNNLPELSEADRSSLAMIASLRATGEAPGFFDDDGDLLIELDYEGIRALESPVPLDDRGIRQYIARRFYLAWQEEGFDKLVEFRHEDTALTGADYSALLRNLQVLEQDGYVTLHRTMGTELTSLRGFGTAKLIREVERFGGPAPDVDTEPEFEAAINAVGSLDTDRVAILAERRRYELARTSAELASVFRALMPITEDVVRRLLRSHGSTRQHSTLGPMIGELRERSVGSIAIWSQLTALQNNVRDVSLHGGELPTGTLRVACETCFGLLPLLGGLFGSSA